LSDRGSYPGFTQSFFFLRKTTFNIGTRLISSARLPVRTFVNRTIQIIHFYLLGPCFCHNLNLGSFCTTCRRSSDSVAAPSQQRCAHHDPWAWAVDGALGSPSKIIEQPLGKIRHRDIHHHQTVFFQN
jgi:hypothetical protein